MDGDTLVLACTEEDWDYTNDLAEDLSQTGMNIFRVEYDVSDLAGPGLFQLLDDLAAGEASCDIMLLLPRNYATNQANSTRPTTERYVFHVSVDESNPSVSPPWINCIKRPGPYKIRPGSIRASSRHPFDQANLPDSFNKPRQPIADNLRRLPEKKEKPTDRPDKQNKTRRLVAVLRDFEERIRFDSANPAAYSGLGNALWCLKRYDEAYQAFLRAIQFDPGNAVAYNGLGSTFWCLEMYDKALQCYEEAARLS